MESSPNNRRRWEKSPLRHRKRGRIYLREPELKISLSRLPWNHFLLKENEKSMELPKFNETFLPILEALKDGKIIKGRDLVRLVEEQFYSYLPDDLLDQTTKSGDRLIGKGDRFI